jgi:hypothetical protein
MNLKEIVHSIQQHRLKDSDDALKNIANSEKYLQQAYEGRYLFELIQNVRDANKEANLKGAVLIELRDGKLTVANTGTPFSQRGINSITTIGDSPKDSQEFIGFKGIGFKSVHEISDTPFITTQWGSIVFDKNRSKPLLEQRGFRDRDIPLFFIPHFHEEFLTEEEMTGGIVTKVVLPLKPRISLESILKSFNEIGIHQLLLLGNLKTVHLKNGSTVAYYTIEEEIRTGKVTIKKNGEIYEFKHFKPSVKARIPESVIDNLEDKEREIYEKAPFVDISLLFDLDQRGGLTGTEKSKLYLFYPTEITSGFRFVIHSYFLVSPDRKNLRDSLLNKFILTYIADYLSGEWLIAAKKLHKNTFLDFLAFSRNSEAPILNALYDRLVEKLKSQKILYDRESGRFYSLQEAIIADGFDKVLFPDHQLNGKRLIYIHDPNTRDWLLREFDAEYLSYDTIAENIEKECVRQKNRKNFKFFENLYQYLVQFDNLNLKGRNVLLTGKMQLLSSDDYVFYGLKEKIQFPLSIQSKIHFIHPSIRISDQRQGKGQTGFIEFNTELLVRRLLKLYEDESTPKADILISLLKLQITDRLLPDIRQKVMLPVKGKRQWVNPFSSPVYLESTELRDLYPEDRFINFDPINNTGIPLEELQTKMKQLGAWDVPAVYYSNNQTTVHTSDTRYRYIFSNIRSYTTPYFTIYGDWLLDKPSVVTRWFTEKVIASWTLYISRIQDDEYPALRFKSQTSDIYAIPTHQQIHVTSFLKYLKTERWVKVEGKDGQFSVGEIVGIDPIESIQVQSFLFRKYLYTLAIHYSSNHLLIQLLGIKHLDGKAVANFKALFMLIYQTYKGLIEPNKEFISFYNKVISKLFDFYSLPSTNKDDLSLFSDCMFLGINEHAGRLEWKAARQIYYIEDKPAYDILPSNIKAIIQPHYTNRDKNRFGQIGKRIGQNFKKVIQQKLTNVILSKELEVWQWFPFFFEALALVEVLLETNLDSKLEELKSVKVLVCEEFRIELFKDGVYVSALENVSHKIENNDIIKLYVRENEGIPLGILYANVLHDLLVEILGRDLQRVRLSLNDFFSRTRKQGYLESYEVSPERVEDISLRFKGIVVSKIQAFWLAILNLKKVVDPASFLYNETVDFSRLIAALDLSEEVFDIDYVNLYATENIIPLHRLFGKLGIRLMDFNEAANINLNFADYFNRQLEGYKLRYRLAFEIQAKEYLTNKTLLLKSSFQDIMDEYDGFIRLDFTEPLLYIDIKQYFLKTVNAKYSFASLEDSDTAPRKNPLNVIFKKNMSAFKKAIQADRTDSSPIDDFFEFNKNRSLLYFDQTIDELVTRFNSFREKRKAISADKGAEEQNDLSKYKNLPGVKIEHVGTGSVEPKNPTENNPSSGAGGKRVDGSKTNPNAELVGIVAEKQVFEKLSELYSSVEWISKNAAKAGVNPEGTDLHACDIKYTDHDNQLHYVEVKGKIDDQKQFYISFPEYCKAINERENYHLFVVLNALDNPHRKILDLGNIFLLEDDTDLFNNKRFTANFCNLEIRFQ